MSYNSHHSHGNPCGCKKPTCTSCNHSAPHMPPGVIGIPHGYTIFQGNPCPQTPASGTTSTDGNTEEEETIENANTADFSVPAIGETGSFTLPGASGLVQPGWVITFPTGSVTVDSVSGDNVYFTNEDIPAGTTILSGTQANFTVPIPATVLLAALNSFICPDQTCGTCDQGPEAIDCLKGLMVCGKRDGGSSNSPMPVSMDEFVLYLTTVEDANGDSIFQNFIQEQNVSYTLSTIPEENIGEVIFISGSDGSPIAYYWNETTGQYEELCQHREQFLDPPVNITNSSGSGSVNLNTLSGVTVPTWANHAIVRARAMADSFDGEGDPETRVTWTANGIEVLNVRSNLNESSTNVTKGDVDEATSADTIRTIPLSGNTISYTHTKTGGESSSEQSLEIVGFKQVCY